MRDIQKEIYSYWLSETEKLMGDLQDGLSEVEAVERMKAILKHLEWLEGCKERLSEYV